MRYPVWNLGQLPFTNIGPTPSSYTLLSECEQIPKDRLLDRYNCEQAEFRRKFEPRPSSHGTAPPLSTRGNRPVSEPAAPSTVRTVTPISNSDYWRFCKLVQTFDASPPNSDARQAAIDEFNGFLKTFRWDYRQIIIDYVQESCPSPDFYYNLVSLAPSVRRTAPYVSPGRPVATGEPGWVHQPARTYQPASEMTPSIAPKITTVPMTIPAPVTQPTTTTSMVAPGVATQGAGSNQCPEDMWWDGLKCRPKRPGIPTYGIPSDQAAAQAASFPGLTMGAVRVVNL